MRNILLTISYDGTNFYGWQRQVLKEGKELNTVQGKLEEALEKLHKQKTILYGSGRTDAGVHALGQSANFFSPIDSIPVKNYVRALNSLLPNTIRITDANEVLPQFNARFSAVSRIYRYFISFQENIHAVENRYSWSVNYKPDIENLNSLASCLKGEIDCASFAAAGDESLSTYRYLEKAHFFYEKFFPAGKDILVFEIEANAFLWKMVRTVTGTLIHLDKIKAAPDSMEKILNAKKRSHAYAAAPAKGLFLYKINFDGIRRHV